MFDSGHKKPDKRKKVKGGDAEEIDNFLGPWAKYVDEKSVAKPTEVRQYKYSSSNVSSHCVLQTEDVTI